MALQGIDISNWQSDLIIDNIDCDFAIVKATQGNWYTSQTLKHQADATIASGKKLGLYHYAEGSDVESEVNHFLEVAKPYLFKAILCLDWESYQNRGFGVNDYAWCKTFLDKVFHRTGVRPLLYCQQSIKSRFDGIGNYGLWVAQYPNNDIVDGFQERPWNEGKYQCAIRQYTSNGRLPGYRGALDLDKFYGDRTAWDLYANPNGQKEVESGWIQKTDGLHYFDENGKEVIFIPGWGGAVDG